MDVICISLMQGQVISIPTPIFGSVSPEVGGWLIQNQALFMRKKNNVHFCGFSLKQLLNN